MSPGADAAAAVALTAGGAKDSPARKKPKSQVARRFAAYAFRTLAPRELNEEWRARWNKFPTKKSKNRPHPTNSDLDFLLAKMFGTRAFGKGGQWRDFDRQYMQGLDLFAFSVRKELGASPCRVPFDELFTGKPKRPNPVFWPGDIKQWVKKLKNVQLKSPEYYKPRFRRAKVCKR